MAHGKCSPIAHFELNTGGIVSNAATILLDGVNSNLVLSNGMNALVNLASNEASGSLTIQDGRSFSSAGAITNAGSLTIGAGSILMINGDYTQTAAGTLTTEIGGSPSSGEFGQIVIIGSASLDGTLNIMLMNGFTHRATAMFTRF